MADLEFEAEAVLELLQDDEELCAVVPGMRSQSELGEQQVLIAVTDRRVVVVGRSKGDATDPRVVDVTRCSTRAPREVRRLPHDGGHLTLDLDDASLARIWMHIDGDDRYGGNPPSVSAAGPGVDGPALARHRGPLAPRAGPPGVRS